MEIVHVVAINPYRKGNKGKVFSYHMDTYDKVIESDCVKKMIQQIRGELPIDGVDLNDAQAVKKAQERLKSELPFFCPHYGMFKNNVRRQENAMPESFLFQTIIDVDDKEYVEKAIEKARELNCSSGIWNGSLLHLCYSARKKLHIGIRMPVGMTIEETQKAYCEALGVPYDESCITPERMIFLTDKDSEIYRSKMWCAVLPESEIQARRKAFLDRGLTVDGRGDAKVNSLQLTVNSNSNVQNNRLSGNRGDYAAPAVALGTLSIASIVASHNILKKRNVALAAAYATVDKTFKEYRNRVVERFGAEVDKELRYNIKAKKFEETVTDPDSGKEKKVKSTVDVAAPSTNDYARFFDDTCEAYESNMDYNLMYLRSQQNLANDKLKANGYLFLSDVYDQLGIKRTKMSQIVGWIYKPEGNENGDNFVDFGILETNRETEDGGYEKAILMEFNVDGPILDLI